MLFGFVGRVILVRYTTQSEYGIYCLALTVISIFVTISTLGLVTGSTRYIAYFRGKEEEGKVGGDQKYNMMSRCYFCKGKVVEKKVKVDFRWGDELVVIEDVPAEVCQQRGEKYFSPEVYKEMENLAKTKENPVKHIE